MTTDITDPLILKAIDVATKADPNAFKHSEVRKIKRGFKTAIDLVAKQQHTIIDLLLQADQMKDERDHNRVIVNGLNAATNTLHRQVLELTAKNDQADADLCAHQTIIQEQGNQIAELTATNDSLRDDVTALILERNQFSAANKELRTQISNLPLPSHDLETD